MKRGLLAGVITCAVVSQSLPVLAAPGDSSLAVGPAVVSGEPMPGLVDGVDAAIRESLESAGFELVDHDPVCVKSPKRCRAVREGKAAHVVRWSVGVIDRDVSISVEAFDASGKSVAKEEGLCEICGGDEGPDLAAARAASVATAIQASLDAAAEGPEPSATSLDAGGPDPRLETWGPVSLGVGLAALGAGIGLLAVDGRDFQGDCGSDVVDADGDCPNVLNTRWGGASLMTVGAVLGTLGVVWIARTRAWKKRERAPDVALGAGQITVHGRF